MCSIKMQRCRLHLFLLQEWCGSVSARVLSTGSTAGKRNRLFSELRRRLLFPEKTLWRIDWFEGDASSTAGVQKEKKKKKPTIPTFPEERQRDLLQGLVLTVSGIMALALLSGWEVSAGGLLWVKRGGKARLIQKD